MDFITYADKYKLAEAAAVVYEPLKRALQAEFTAGKVSAKRNIRSNRIEATDIELIFRVMPAGSSLRTLVTQGILSHHRMRVGFPKQEQEIDGYAAELVVQMRASFRSVRWIDPITGKSESH